MHLKAPDARVFGYLAWQRYSAIVPKDMYTTLNAATQGIGTGPYMLDGSYVPNDHLNYVRNPQLLEEGAALPRRDHVQDHHRRAGAHRGPACRSDRRRDRLGRQRQRAARRQPGSRC